VSTPLINADVEQQKIMIDAHNNSAYIYCYLSDYRSSYESLVKALLLCEKFGHSLFLTKIYANIGTIYSHFKEYDLSEMYYSKALEQCTDTVNIITIMDNLGSIKAENGKMDTAFYFFNKALKISKRHNNIKRHSILKNMASLYQKKKQYDSAFYYYKMSLAYIKKNDDVKKSYNLELEAECLSDLGKLFFEVHKTDSALFYIDLSNMIAVKNKFRMIMAENYLILSKIAESKGKTEKSLQYFKKYSNLKDSVFSIKNFADIMQLQSLYEISKTNQQIEELVLEQQMKEHTIHYQKIIQWISLSLLFVISMILLFVLFQKKQLNRAYRVLFEKNIEFIDSQENTSEMYRKKYKKSSLTRNMQDELLEKILTLMEDKAIVCDPEFSLDKLSEILHTNQSYVSQVINNVFKKNFRLFLNEFRIRKAQQLLADWNATKYSIEFVSSQVGFKSTSTFRVAFKEITGITPKLYIENIAKKG
jgi:YesN/AraC family two-component response regulator